MLEAAAQMIGRQFNPALDRVDAIVSHSESELDSSGAPQQFSKQCCTAHCLDVTMENALSTTSDAEISTGTWTPAPRCARRFSRVQGAQKSVVYDLHKRMTSSTCTAPSIRNRVASSSADIRIDYHAREQHTPGVKC